MENLTKIVYPYYRKKFPRIKSGEAAPLPGRLTACTLGSDLPKDNCLAYSLTSLKSLHNSPSEAGLSLTTHQSPLYYSPLPMLFLDKAIITDIISLFVTWFTVYLLPWELHEGKFFFYLDHCLIAIPRRSPAYCRGLVTMC